MFRIIWPSLPWLWGHPVATSKRVRKCSFVWTAFQSYCSASGPSSALQSIKPKGKYTRSRHINRNESLEIHSNLLSELPKLQYVSVTDLNEIMTHFKKRDYTLEEMKKDKNILFLSYNDLELRFYLLQEFGIFKPRLYDVLYIGVFMESKVSLLRSLGVLRDHFDVLENLLETIKELELPEDVLAKIKYHFRDIEDFSLAYIHLYILLHYISHRFMIDLKMAQDLFKIHRLPSWKPLLAYPRICQIITKVISANFTYVLDHPQLLNLDPLNVVRIFKLCPKIGEVSVVEVAKEHPDLLLIPFERVLEWYKLLQNYKVKKLLVTPEVLNLFKKDVPNKLDERLKLLRTLPEFEEIAASEGFSQVLLNPSAIKKLLNVAQAEQSHQEINTVLKDVEKMPIIPKKISASMRTYIACQLGIDEEQKDKYKNIRELRTSRGFENTQKILTLLMEYGFSAEQIINGIQVLSFEYNALKSTLDKFASMPEVQPYEQWMEKPQVIHLLSYLVMRDNPS